MQLQLLLMMGLFAFIHRGPWHTILNHLFKSIVAITKMFVSSKPHVVGNGFAVTIATMKRSRTLVVPWTDTLYSAFGA